MKLDTSPSENDSLGIAGCLPCKILVAAAKLGQCNPNTNKLISFGGTSHNKSADDKDSRSDTKGGGAGDIRLERWWTPGPVIA